MKKDAFYWHGFHWKAELIRVIDGDTIVVSALIAPRNSLEIHLRFARINAPEVRGEEREEGLVSKEALEQILEEVDELLLWTTKLDTFGSRYVTEIYFVMNWGVVNLNDMLVDAGFATYAQSRDLENPSGWVMS